MAFLSGRLNPVKLPPDEKIILRKRESLRTRGIAWLGGITWLFALFAAYTTLFVAQAAGRETTLEAINPTIILFAILLLPATLIVFTMWLAGSYELGQSEIRTSDNTAARLLATQQVILDLRQVEHVEIAKPGLPDRLFDLGDVILSTRNTPAAMIIRSIERPQVIRDEIDRRVKQAHIRARAGQEQAATEKDQILEIRRSGAWLMLKWLPLAYVLLGTVVAWVVVELSAVIDIPELRGFFGILLVISILLLIPGWTLSFLRWWFRLYVITDRRVIKREGILNITSRILSLDDVVTATAVRSGLGRFFDVGHVQIMTAGRSGDVHMQNVSAPDFVRQCVLETQELTRLQREHLATAEISQQLKVALRL
jgi:membrane protein YdbS with pleckstrin-like domain